MSDAPRLLISAGPTHEPIDAVRYLGNRSSGRLGCALATASVAAGCPTTLLLGPTACPAPEDSAITTHRFQSCADLQSLLAECWPKHDLLLMAAAVADYRPRTVRTDEKLRRTPGRMSLELEATPDLLAELAANSRSDQFRIGWALEPRERLIESARAKLERKQLDAIVANPLGTLDSDEIEPVLLLADGSMHRPSSKRLAKSDFAVWLVEKCLKLSAKA